MKLKQCPKCGGKRNLLKDESIWLLGGYRIRWFVKCRDCGYKVGPYLDPEEAHRRWNGPRRKKK